MTNNNDILDASITLNEFLERISNSKHQTRDKDLLSFYDAYRTFQNMQQELLILRKDNFRYELNNTILSIEIEKLKKQNKGLISGL